MDGVWTDGRTVNGSGNGIEDERMYRRTDDGRTGDGRTDRETDRQRDGWTGGWTDGRQSHKQIFKNVP